MREKLGIPKLIDGGNDIFYLEDVNTPIPRKMIINGISYFRFCDFILIPLVLEDLSPEQVITVNKIRSQHIEYMPQFQINLKVRTYFQEFIKQLRPEVVLELGPGINPLFKKPCGSIKKMYFADFSHLAIEELRKQQILCEFFPIEGVLNISDRSIDFIFSIFVLQFNISSNQIKEIYRILTDNGIFVANLYNRSANSRKMLIESFIESGFVYAKIGDPHKICKGHEYLLLSKSQITGRLLSIVTGIINSNFPL